MRKREFVFGAGSVIVSLASQAVLPKNSEAAQECSIWQPFRRGSIRSCEVEVDLDVSARQKCQNWCWAACIEAAFRAYDYELDQEDIVEELYGPKKPCRRASLTDISKLIRRKWKDSYGSEFKASVIEIVNSEKWKTDATAIQKASRHLHNERPLIIGALGHATLVTKMTWIEDNFGKQKLESIVVHDPWPYNQSPRTLKLSELRRTGYLAAVRVRSV